MGYYYYHNNYEIVDIFIEVINCILIIPIIIQYFIFIVLYNNTYNKYNNYYYNRFTIGLQLIIMLLYNYYTIIYSIPIIYIYIYIYIYILKHVNNVI